MCWRIVIAGVLAGALAGVCVSGCGGGGGGGSAQTGRYRLVDLGVLPGFTGPHFGLAINASGDVAGYGISRPGPDPDRIFRGFARIGNTMNAIPTFGGDDSTAENINDARQVAGTANGGGGPVDDRPYLWENGMMTPLPRLGGQLNRVYGLNNSGHAVGFSEDGSGKAQGVIWRNGGVSLLGTLPSGATSTPYDINDLDDVAGASGGKPFLWRNGTIQDLGLPPGGFTRAEALALNNGGTVLVNAFTAAGVERAFLWSGGQFVDIGIRPGFRSIHGTDLNAAGHVVGWMERSDGTRSAFLYRNGELTELNDLISSTPAGFIAFALGGTLPGDAGTGFFAINDTNQIAGTGIFGSSLRPIRLDPL